MNHISHHCSCWWANDKARFRNMTFMDKLTNLAKGYLSDDPLDHTPDRGVPFCGLTITVCSIHAQLCLLFGWCSSKAIKCHNCEHTSHLKGSEAFGWRVTLCKWMVSLVGVISCSSSFSVNFNSWCLANILDCHQGFLFVLMHHKNKMYGTITSACKYRLGSIGSSVWGTR